MEHGPGMELYEENSVSGEESSRKIAQESGDLCFFKFRVVLGICFVLLQGQE